MKIRETVGIGLTFLMIPMAPFTAFAAVAITGSAWALFTPLACGVLGQIVCPFYDDPWDGVAR